MPPPRRWRAGSPFPHLALLRVGFAEPSGSPRALVRSYRTVSTLPVTHRSPGPAHRRSVLCGTFLRVTPTGISPAPCPVEPRPSSTRSANCRTAATQPAHHRSHYAPLPSRDDELKSRHPFTEQERQRGGPSAGAALASWAWPRPHRIPWRATTRAAPSRSAPDVGREDGTKRSQPATGRRGAEPVTEAESAGGQRALVVGWRGSVWSIAGDPGQAARDLPTSGPILLLVVVGRAGHPVKATGVGEVRGPRRRWPRSSVKRRTAGIRS